MSEAMPKTRGIKPLDLVREQIETATDAAKCHPCGCFQSTVAALERTELAKGELAGTLARAREAFAPKRYDCLGCPVCFPAIAAIAANALADALPAQADTLDLCPVEIPAERAGWPPLAGDYHVVRYRASIAVCALNSDDLAAELSRRAPEGLAIAGTLRTENLGIERIIRNVRANPHIRFLILCGEDTRQAVGHLPGQSLAMLFANGLDDRGRISGAQGKRPVLKNVACDEVDAFLAQVELVPMIGETDADRIAEKIADCRARDPGPVATTIGPAPVETIRAAEPRRLVLDPAGYVVVYLDAARGCVSLEHYTNAGVLDAIIEGQTATAVYATAIERKLVSRLDHAAYLGCELARAEQSLRTGEPYVQDRAPGEEVETPRGGCGCSSSTCGGEP